MQNLELNRDINLLVINILPTYHMRKVGTIRTWKRSVRGTASGTKNITIAKRTMSVCLWWVILTFEGDPLVQSEALRSPPNVPTQTAKRPHYPIYVRPPQGGTGPSNNDKMTKLCKYCNWTNRNQIISLYCNQMVKFIWAICEFIGCCSHLISQERFCRFCRLVNG